MFRYHSEATPARDASRYPPTHSLGVASPKFAWGNARQRTKAGETAEGSAPGGAAAGELKTVRPVRSRLCFMWDPVRALPHLARHWTMNLHSRERD